MSINISLERVRESRGLTEKEVAVKLGVPVTSVKYWESGKNKPSLDTLIRLSEIYNVSLDVLVGREEDKVIIENCFSVEEFRVITNLLKEKAQNEQDFFNTYNTLFDKAEVALNSMIKAQRLHKFDYAPKERDKESGNFFLIRREKLHISRSDLAEACGVSSNVVCEWESGTRKPTRNMIETLQKWLKLTDKEVQKWIDPNYNKKNHIELVMKELGATNKSLNNMVNDILA